MGLKEVLGTAKDCGAVITWAVISRTCLLVLQVRNYTSYSFIVENYARFVLSHDQFCHRRDQFLIYYVLSSIL